MKMYIAVLDEAPDYMVPTLIAHSVINAHIKFITGPYKDQYQEWLNNSYRKVVVKVNRKEFEKIKEQIHWAGHENTICEGKPSCLVVLPVYADNIPNVLKFAKMWKPNANTQQNV